MLKYLKNHKKLVRFINSAKSKEGLCRISLFESWSQQMGGGVLHCRGLAGPRRESKRGRVFGGAVTSPTDKGQFPTEPAENSRRHGE